MIHLLDNEKVKKVKKQNMNSIKGGYVLVDISTPYMTNIYTIVKGNKFIHSFKPARIIIDIGLHDEETGIDNLVIHSEQEVKDYHGYYSIFPLQGLLDNISESIVSADIYMDTPRFIDFILEDKKKIVSLMEYKIFKTLKLKTHVAHFNDVNFIYIDKGKWDCCTYEEEIPVSFDSVIILYPFLETVHLLSRIEYNYLKQLNDFDISILLDREDEDLVIGSFEGIEFISFLQACIYAPDVIKMLTIIHDHIIVDFQFCYNGEEYTRRIYLEYGESLNIYQLLMEAIIREVEV